MTSSSDDGAAALRNRFAPPGSPAGEDEVEPVAHGKPASVWMLQLVLPFMALLTINALRTSLPVMLAQGRLDRWDVLELCWKSAQLLLFVGAPLLVQRRSRWGRLAGQLGIGLSIAVIGYVLVVGIIGLLLDPSARIAFTWVFEALCATLLLLLFAWFHAFSFSPAACAWFHRGTKG